MNIFDALVLGVVQGLAEFLPVSSSGHLWLFEKFLGITPRLDLEVVLHVGSLLAVVIFFHKKIWTILRGMFCGERLGWQLVVATMCTVPLALGVEKIWNPDLTSSLVAITLLITAGLIVAAEFFRPKSERKFTWSLAVALGLVQGIAVLPGISRSGLTIAFLILLGVRRRESAEISFLLSIPTILGALVFALADGDAGTAIFAAPETWLAFAVSAVAAAAAIAWMMKLIEKNWIWFAPYCAVLAAGVFIFAH